MQAEVSIPTDEEIGEIRRLHHLLQEELRGVGQRGITYLTLANGGAAATCIAFMGGQDGQESPLTLRLLFLVFVVGLLLVGGIIAGEYSHLRPFFLNYSIKAGQCIAGAVPYGEVVAVVQENQTRLLRIARINQVLGFASFGTFFAGALAACAWLLLG